MPPVSHTIGGTRPAVRDCRAGPRECHCDKQCDDDSQRRLHAGSPPGQLPLNVTVSTCQAPAFELSPTSCLSHDFEFLPTILPFWS